MPRIWPVLIILNLLFVFPVMAVDAPDKQEKQTVSNFPKQLPDEFQILTELRQKVMVYKDALENEIRKMEEERSYLPRSIHEIDLKVTSLKSRIEQDKKTIAALEKKAKLTEKEQKNLEDLQYYIQEDERSIERSVNDKNRLIELDAQIATGKQNLSSTSNYFESVEHKIASLLNIEEERNTFRKWISFTFCGLVAIVIVGFYVIAFRKDAIAESIFSGEKGIQFVAIFLIVIAIILFGIMGILESKELSALLGGLSGYILGRVSRQSN